MINVSAFTLTAIQPLLLMLPSHVRERVHILGADWEQFLAADLDEEALSFLKDADRHTLAWHRGRWEASLRGVCALSEADDAAELASAGSLAAGFVDAAIPRKPGARSDTQRGSRERARYWPTRGSGRAPLSQRAI